MQTSPLSCEKLFLWYHRMHRLGGLPNTGKKKKPRP